VKETNLIEELKFAGETQLPAADLIELGLDGGQLALGRVPILNDLTSVI